MLLHAALPDCGIYAMCDCAPLATVRMYRSSKQAGERSEAMENAVLEIEYREHMRQLAWMNEHDRQFEQPAKKHPVRQAIARALITLAEMVAPATKREAQTV
jgi:hypothetical protein